ncbi:N-acetyltransferase [Streptomyces sp. NPDC054756]
MRREPRIIRVGPGHLARTVAMHRRCSPQTLWSRYHRAMADPRTYVPTLLSRPGSVHLAALGATGRILAVGHLMPDHTAVEAALLVEDSWQGRGRAGDERIDAMLRHAPAPVRCTEEGGAVTAWVPVHDLAAGLPVPRR